MKEAFYLVFTAALLYAVCLLVGNALLQRLRPKLARAEAMLFGFVIGSALFSSVVFVVAKAGLARKGWFFAASAVLMAAAISAGGHRWPKNRQLAAVSKKWWIAFVLIYGLFAALYVSTVFSAEAEGSTHVLAAVSRDAQVRGMASDSHDIPAIRDGASMLFLFGFTIRHSAAPAAALLFLLTCPWGMLAYGRRVGHPEAGVVGGLLFLASPIVGKVGTSVSVDVIVACALFAIFYGIEVWRAERQTRLWIPIAVMAAFGAWIFIPWLRWNMSNPWPGAAWSSDGAYDLTIRGLRLHGLLGPVFLLAPLGLLALRYPAGRRLVPMAALTAFPFLAAMETSSLVPSLPFVSLALALVLTAWRAMAPAVLFVHVLLSWPAFIPLYCDPGAWKIEMTSTFLRHSVAGFEMGQFIDAQVPAGEPVFSIRSFPMFYVRHEVINGADSAVGREMMNLRSDEPGHEADPSTDLVRLRAKRIHWLLVADTDPRDFWSNSQKWGVRLAAHLSGYQLYSLVEPQP